MNNRKFRWGIREKLTLLFFGVTLIAVSVNFLIAVPRLEQRLTNDRVKAMREIAQRQNQQIQAIVSSLDPQLVSPAEGGIWPQVLDPIAASTGERAAILRVDTATNPVDPRFIVVYDPTGETANYNSISDPIAHRAIQTKRITSGLSTFGTGAHAEAAAPIFVGDQPLGAIVYTTSLSSVNAIVKQQARRNIAAGVIALGIALMAGLIASSYMARRLRRLENAAREVSKGNFTEPIQIDAEDEIGEVARAFNAMQERLGRADRARKAFIANASHELRTPLFSLGGYVELMREEDLDPETQREFLDIMHKQIDRMTKLATDLLDLSKIDTGSLDIQPENVNVGDLVKSLAREFEPLAAEHDTTISVEVPEGLEAICDPDRVAQIVRVLVDNALSHTPPGTNLEIAAAPEGDGVALRIADDGPGIPAEDMGRIFDRFHTGDKTGGTGLGLSIALELATAMGGTISVESEPGETVFTLFLPARVARAAQPA